MKCEDLLYFKIVQRNLNKFYDNSFNLWSPNLLIDFTVASSFHMPKPKISIRNMLTPGVRDAKIAPRRPELQCLGIHISSNVYVVNYAKLHQS